MSGMKKGHREFEHEMISTPGRRLMHHVKLKFVKKKVKGGGGRGVNAALNLTSFIDFLIVVVVFFVAITTHLKGDNFPGIPVRAVQ